MNFSLRTFKASRNDRILTKQASNFPGLNGLFPHLQCCVTDCQLMYG